MPKFECALVWHKNADSWHLYANSLWVGEVAKSMPPRSTEPKYRALTGDSTVREKFDTLEEAQIALEGVVLERLGRVSHA